MSYIDNNLLPDERILFRTRKHIIIFLAPLVWLVFTFMAAVYMSENPMLTQLQWAPWLVAVIWWGQAALEYVTSEFAVTNKRIMMREGFFYRHANEMRLSAISQVNVEQSLIGQALNYGSVVINAFGAYDGFSYLAQPYLFQKHVNEGLDRLVR